jgi:3-oxoacyl-[acyl-carrier-protein] synthase II
MTTLASCRSYLLIDDGRLIDDLLPDFELTPLKNDSTSIVVTGIGLITPLGNEPDIVWKALQERRNGIGRITWVPVEYLPTDLFGAVQFTGQRADYGEISNDLWRRIQKSRKLMSREVEIGVAAGQKAILNAGISPADGDPNRKGCVFGSDYTVVNPLEFSQSFHQSRFSGEIDLGRWGSHGFRSIDPLWTLKYAPNMPAGHVAILNQLQGPVNAITMREASSNLALHSAAMQIQKGVADVMVVGTTGSRVHSLMTQNSSLGERLAPRHADPLNACRPFHRHSQGAVIAEGAAAVVLESRNCAELEVPGSWPNTWGLALPSILQPRQHQV